MKRLFCILLWAFIGLAAGAQTRTYTDNASGTFIFGLENYFYGRSGSLEFQADGKTFNVGVENGDVSVNKAPLEGGMGEVVVGTHDFTGNRIPELVVARRNKGLVCLTLYFNVSLMDDDCTDLLNDRDFWTYWLFHNL